ncbi:MAG: hypothetical protein Q7R64_00760 [bacterium]|nr:hypothetical protein [bacterium]
MADPAKKDDGKDKPKSDGDIASTEGTSDPLLKEFADAMKKYFGFDLDLNFFSSAFNPEIDALAKRCADEADKRLSKDSFARTSTVSRGLGVLAAALENMGDRKTGKTRALFKKGSDFLETFGTYFYGRSIKKDSGGESHDEVSHGGVSTERAKQFDAGDAKLAQNGLDLILMTPPTGFDEIREINRERAKAWHEHKEIVRHGPPKEKVEPEPGVPFSEWLHQVDEGVEKALKPVSEKLEKDLLTLKADTARKQEEQRAERAAKPKTFQSKLRRWLF